MHFFIILFISEIQMNKYYIAKHKANNKMHLIKNKQRFQENTRQANNT